MRGPTIETVEHLCEHLLEDYGVAVILGSAFGASGHFRLSFPAAEPELAEGMQQVHGACVALDT